MHEIARVRALLAALRTLFVFCHLTVATRRRGDLIPGVTETIVTMLLTCSKAGIKSRSTHPGTVRVVRCFKADSLSWPAHPGTFRAARCIYFSGPAFPQGPLFQRRQLVVAGAPRQIPGSACHVLQDRQFFWAGAPRQIPGSACHLDCRVGGWRFDGKHLVRKLGQSNYSLHYSLAYST